MAKITYIEFNGAEHVVDVATSQTVMEGAKKNNIPGIEADCLGQCSCGTCHVLVDPAWLERVGPRTEIEVATLEFVEDIKPNSRLSCQVKVTDALDGLIVRIPESQR